MKLSFSTGGWPFSLEECASLAMEMRYDGLEISTESLNRFEQSGAPLSPGRLHDTARKLNEDAFFDWLDKFDRTDLMQALGEVQDVYVSAKKPESEAKKNSD